MYTLDSVARFANFPVFLYYVLYYVIAATFDPKLIEISASDTIIKKICELCKAIFPTRYSFFKNILGYYFFLKVLSGNSILLVIKIIDCACALPKAA